MTTDKLANVVEPSQSARDADFCIDERDDDMLICERHWQFGWRCIARRPKLLTNDEWRPEAERVVVALTEQRGRAHAEAERAELVAEVGRLKAEIGQIAIHSNTDWDKVSKDPKWALRAINRIACGVLYPDPPRVREADEQQEDS